MKITLIDCEQYPDNAARMAMTCLKKYPDQKPGQRHCVIFTIPAPDYGMDGKEEAFAIWRTKSGNVTVQKAP